MADGIVSPDPDDKKDCAIVCSLDGYEWSNAWFQLAITAKKKNYLVKMAEIAVKRINVK